MNVPRRINLSSVIAGLHEKYILHSMFSKINLRQVRDKTGITFPRREPKIYQIYIVVWNHQLSSIIKKKQIKMNLLHKTSNTNFAIDNDQSLTALQLYS